MTSPSGPPGYDPLYPAGGHARSGGFGAPSGLGPTGGFGPRPKTRLRERRGLMIAGIVLGLAAMAASVFGVASQFMPRSFSASQRQQIMAWEVGKRWRTWPAGQIFPATVPYNLPGSAFGDSAGLNLVAHRVGIARQAGCSAAATNDATARALRSQHCLAVLRATYTDETQSLAVTVGVAVLPSAAAARRSSKTLADEGGPRAMVRAVHFRRTDAAAFNGRSGQVPWQRVAGPYLVLAAAGYADGRPWRSAGNDFYIRTEMVSLAGGIGRAVASKLDAPPPQPHCPGSPAC
jgi:hypothetical protein